MMNITGVTMPAEGLRAYQPQPQQYAAPQTQKGALARRFDSVTIESGRGSFELELRGRVSQEVRTATSSGLVASLREQVRAGTYQVDFTGIARKMLLREGG